ncbi:hypothetical protein KJ693_04800 [bacterium]|nr:hypothetical protein [bacterium]MBU1614615.1 hypothetical protein [bacterium]
METITIDPRLKEIASYLEPAPDINVTLSRLLAKELDRELAIYEQMDSQFQKQYGMLFEKFYDSFVSSSETFSPATEQDYFDWEMATTTIKELREELGKLELSFKVSTTKKAGLKAEELKDRLEIRREQGTF